MPMGNIFDYKRGPVDEEVKLRDEAPPHTPKKKRKREISDSNLYSDDEGIINPETPRYIITISNYCIILFTKLLHTIFPYYYTTN